MTNLPPPLVVPPQPIAYATVSADDQHLRLLAIFHYIWGGLTATASSLGLIHVTLGIVMLVNPGVLASPRQPPPPAFMGWMVLLLGAAIALIGWTLGALTIYSGRCISRRRHRTFSLVMAGINCLSVPLGTALGVFTFIVLLRPPVAAEYEYRRSAPR
jgi:hypothetical protein